MTKQIFSKLLLLLLLFLIIHPAALAQTSPRRDGNAWRDLQDDWKTFMITGLFEGIKLGHNFSIWQAMSEAEPGKPNAVIASITQSYDKHHAFLNNITVGQMVAGLDDFYSDYKNRSIMIRDAVWIVANIIHGTPKDKVDRLIENLRKTSGLS